MLCLCQNIVPYVLCICVCVVQLFMIEPLRCGILAVEGAISNKEDELFIDDKLDSEVKFSFCFLIITSYVITVYILFYKLE